MDTISHYIYSHKQLEILDPYDTAEMILLFFDQWLNSGLPVGNESFWSDTTPILPDDALDLAISVFAS